MNTGKRTRAKVIPLVFMAVSSLFSPRLPKVMREESRMESGKATGTILRLK